MLQIEWLGSKSITPTLLCQAPPLETHAFDVGVELIHQHDR